MTIVQSPVAGSLMMFHVTEGADVSQGENIATVEAMKMMFDVESPCAGRVSKLCALAGEYVTEGQPVAEIEESL